MITRILAAAVGLAVLLPAVIWGGTLAVEVIVPLAMVLCWLEYAGMAFPDDLLPSGAWLCAGGLGTYAAALYGPDGLGSLVGALVVLVSLILVTFRPLPLEGAADRVGRYVLGHAWVGFLVFLPLLRRLDDGLAWVFLVLAISWCSDTGGYFAGRAFGRTRLYPTVSPKKTWEGVAGGVALAVVGVFGVRAVGLPQLTAIDCVVLGVVLSALGILGDLAESLLKRAFDVKDSGWILPGHGGLLDRIDSVLFVAPLLYGYVVVVKGG